MDTFCNKIDNFKNIKYLYIPGFIEPNCYPILFEHPAWRIIDY